MSVTMYACMDLNRGIGVDTKLPWSIPREMSEFLEKVKGKTCIVGGITYSDLPKSFKENNECVIYTRTPWGYPDLGTIQNLEVLPNLAKEKDYAVIGGSELYRRALPFTDVIDLSIVMSVFSCTHFFPEFDESKWVKIYRGTCNTKDRDGKPISFKRYRYIRK